MKLLILILLSSCISNTKVTKDKYKRFNISTKRLGIKSTKEIDWVMFNEKKTKLHMGFQVHISLPVFSKSDLNSLYREKGVDSFIVRTTMESATVHSVLGHLEVPLYRYLKSLRSKTITGKKDQKIKKTYFQINYRAASLVPRNVNFICPPLNHRKEIDDIKIKKFIRDVDKFFILEPVNEQRLRARTEKFSASSVVFKGFPSLKGKFSFDVALYDSRKKNRLSNWVRVPEYLEIDKENEINLPECENSPAGGTLYQGGKFKWKRKKLW